MTDNLDDLTWAREIARKVMAGGAQWNDVDPDMADPLADAIVAALAEPLRRTKDYQETIWRLNKSLVEAEQRIAVLEQMLGHVAHKCVCDRCRQAAASIGPK